MPYYDDRTPLQPELFPEDVLRPCLEHELGRLERNWKTGDFDHGWTAATLEARLELAPTK